MQNRLSGARCACCYAALTVLALSACPLAAIAQAVPAPWPALQASYFPGKQLEPAPFIHISAPTRAASGDQVPFAFSIDHPMTATSYIKAVTVLVDANPVPVTAVFHFTPESGKAEMSTRIRFDTDSPVHVVAESNDGKLYVSTVTVKASGGCGGSIAGDDPAVMAAAGKMKMALTGPSKVGAINKARLLIRHPMYTGLQRNLTTNGFRPAYFIQQVSVSYNGRQVLVADTSIGLSENPTLEFGFVADRPGALTVVLQDNTGATFRQAIDVGG
ncbi:quinoprotein dehydrogenase-associated SoxYZ-like carrier [Massilia sp. S19_KUP03_FR1]|uniref:quinoprotein dehydrogenase-associated SoxYZ-like carrier n=1 Tax=Massilia sp. S19_KUP03_FR1 TaxID=3025503 RepID=UPI002FCDD05E